MTHRGAETFAFFTGCTRRQLAANSVREPISTWE
jgi:hypothetical protein